MTLEERLKVYQEKIKQNPLTSVIITIALLLFLLIVVPYVDISHRGINNATVEATLENQSRATLAQIVGGVAIGIGLYYTWRRIGIAEEDLKATQDNLKVAQDNLKVTQENLEATQKVAQDNLKVAQEGQITERFTRAIDQLGSDKLEVRLGGIYALERIANESEKDYWPIMEILTAYVRKNSPIELTNQDRVSLDIQAILTIIGRCNYTYRQGESKRLDLSKTNLKGVELTEAHLEKAKLNGSHLEKAKLNDTHLEKAELTGVYLEKAELIGAQLVKADLSRAHLEGTFLMFASLEETKLREVYFEGSNFFRASLKGADLRKADLRKVYGLSFEQLSRVKTLYKAELDPELEEELRAEDFGYLLDDEPER